MPKPRIPKIIKVLNRARRIYFTGRDPISRACVRFASGVDAEMPRRHERARSPSARKVQHGRPQC